jgi:NTE family protein
MTRAFVLSGGGNLGAVQVGMLDALRERGIVPDLLVGTSVGALNAGYVAGRGMNADAIDELTRVWLRVRRRDVFPFDPVRHVLACPADGRRCAPTTGCADWSRTLCRTGCWRTPTFPST